MPNVFVTVNDDVKAVSQQACCAELCPPLTEMEDNQFLALVMYYLHRTTGINVADIPAGGAQDAAQQAWCASNMETLCSFPPDKAKALIIYMIRAWLLD